MSAEAPTPHPEMPRRRSRVVKSNRNQILLFSILTLVLTAFVVWGGRTWLRNSETLVFAVGEANGPEARFAARLAAVLKNNSSRLRLKIVPNGDNAKALSQFDRKEANLAILRTDARIPPRARSLAILDHDLFLLISPGGKKIKTVADLKKKKIAVIADSESSVALVRNILELPDTPDAAARIQMAPPGSTFDRLFASGFGAVIKVAHASHIVKDKNYEQLARRGGFALNAIDSAKSIARKNPAISEETVATGMLSASPAVPEEDLDTIGLEWLLVAQSKLPTATVADLARIIYENKTELALPDGFASKIEPAATDKDAFIVAHPGAAEYINDEFEVLHRALQRADLCRAGRAQHHRLDLCCDLHQGDAGRAGEGQPARDRHSRYRRAHGIRQITRCARRIAGRTGSCAARRCDRLARRHHFERRAGYFQARL